MFIKLLEQVRLTYLVIILFYLYAVIALLVPGYDLSRALLTLFSANSFLYGFYISPIVKDQSSRISELNQQIHVEATLLYSAALKLRKVPKAMRSKVLGMLDSYVNAVVNFRRDDEEERAYEDIVSYLVAYKGKNQEVVDDLLKDMISNQENRTQRRILLNNSKVYSNEWVIMTLLFSTTIFFIMVIETDDSIVMPLIKALICTGLTMLVAILLKMSTLTHKRAKDLWRPLINLRKSSYYRID